MQVKLQTVQHVPYFAVTELF